MKKHHLLLFIRGGSSFFEVSNFFGETGSCRRKIFPLSQSPLSCILFHLFFSIPFSSSSPLQPFPLPPFVPPPIFFVVGVFIGSKIELWRLGIASSHLLCAISFFSFSQLDCKKVQWRQNSSLIFPLEASWNKKSTTNIAFTSIWFALLRTMHSR